MKILKRYTDRSRVMPARGGASAGEIPRAKPTDKAPGSRERECAGRKTTRMNDRLRPRKEIASSAEPAQYKRRRKVVPDPIMGERRPAG